ncbi:MAG: glycosyltransferase family 39 protein [Deltaproteobacteria bacterium]|nr:glycosyltransferase family 39 protein [Deltaproteobacteria bacterium]
MERASGRRDGAILAAVALFCLLPFVGKAFHIDDPMYIWAAEQVVADPADFYGFDVNWHGFFEPNWIANKNPPLIGFWLAAVSLALGWSEVALHVGMLIPLGALLLAVYGLGRRLTREGALGSGLALLALPVVLVSATTVMSDVLMLSLWCGATWLWMRGVDSGRVGPLLVAGLLMGLCPLAKYFGIALLPLLAAWALARRAPLRLWGPPLLVPLAIVGAYEIYMRSRYGWSPVLDIGTYALTYAPGRARYGVVERAIVGLCFLGGLTLPVLFAAPLLWTRRTLAALAAAGVAATLLAPALGSLGRLPLVDEAGARWDLALHLGIFGLAGAHLLVLGGIDLWRRRDADALLLVLWLGGTWFFASFTNWTATARSLLPAAPAAALLLVRALERSPDPRPVERRPWLAVPLALGLCAGLVVAEADAALANAARRAAREITQVWAPQAPRVVFQGAWGFQQYMQQAGAERLHIDGMQLRPGDVIVTPGTNTNLVELPSEIQTLLEVRHFPSGRFAATLSPERGAGFYASLWGPLPFVFGPAPPERYRVTRVVVPYRIALRPPRVSEPRR